MHEEQHAVQGLHRGRGLDKFHYQGFQSGFPLSIGHSTQGDLHEQFLELYERVNGCYVEQNEDNFCHSNNKDLQILQ